MPQYQYRITDPSTGRTLMVSGGPDPPTEADAAELFEQDRRSRDQPKTLSGFMENVKRSGGEFLGGLTEAVTHPVNTFVNTADILAGAVQKAVPGEQGLESKVDPLWNFYRDRYSSPGQALETAYQDPVGVVADVSTVLGGMGAVAGAASKVPTLGRLGQVARVASRASELTNPTRAITLPAKLAMKEAGLWPIMANTRGTKATREDFGGRRAIAQTIQDEALLTGTGGPAMTSGGAKTGAAREAADAMVAEAQAAGTPGVSSDQVVRGVRADVQPVINRRTILGEPDTSPALTETLERFRAQNPREIPLTQARELTREAQDLAYEMGRENLQVPKLTASARARALRAGVEARVPEVGPLNERTQRLLGATRLIDETDPSLLIPTIVGGSVFGGTSDLSTALGAAALTSPELGRAAGITLGKTGQAIDPYLARLFLLERLSQAGGSNDALNSPPQ